MEPLSLALDAAWATGLLLAVTRVAAFVLASPILARVVPGVGRVALVLALGLFLATPVEGLDLGGLVVAGVANAAVGVVLGFTTGLIFHLFAVAGSLVDMTSGLAAASMIDPTRGEQGAVFSRLFNLTALAMLFVTGGFELVTRGMALSVEALALDGSVSPQAGLVDLTVGLTTRLLVAGAEVALPVLAALFLAELVLGLASRFAPQANVFLLGLPAKLLLTLTFASVALLLFPEAVGGVLEMARGVFVDALRGLGAG